MGSLLVVLADDVLADDILADDVLADDKLAVSVTVDTLVSSTHCSFGTISDWAPMMTKRQISILKP